MALLLSDVLCCPACQGNLDIYRQSYRCAICGRSFGVVDGLPQFLVPSDLGTGENEVMETVRMFYEETPFPSYEDIEDVASLMEKTRRSVFAKMLNDQVPFGARVLDAGCGTGQMTNYLSIASREVVGADMCLNSLRLAMDFRDAHCLDRAHFVQMNLFHPCLKSGTFDLVISNGVLHHTNNPSKAFHVLSRLVRPGGYFLVGLYHRYGRLATDVRRQIFRLTNDRLKWLDRRATAINVGEVRRETWFRDQYKNPHESKHTVEEVLEWFEDSDFSFVRSIPGTVPFHPFDSDMRLFEPDRLGNRFERSLINSKMVLSGHREGGFFIMIGKREK